MAFHAGSTKNGGGRMRIDTVKTIQTLTQRLCNKAEGIKYGQVSATLKIHNGRITCVTYSVTDTEIDKEPAK